MFFNNLNFCGNIFSYSDSGLQISFILSESELINFSVVGHFYLTDVLLLSSCWLAFLSFFLFFFLNSDDPSFPSFLAEQLVSVLSFPGRLFKINPTITLAVSPKLYLHLCSFHLFPCNLCLYIDYFFMNLFTSNWDFTHFC